MTPSTRFARVTLVTLALGAVASDARATVLPYPLESGGTPTYNAPPAPDTHCTRLDTTVALGPGQPAAYHVISWLCAPNRPIQNPTVEVLIPGGGYNHSYWDFPYQPETYSYVWYANRAGYVTLNLDRIGTGESDHPSSALPTEQASAYVVHQLVQALRNGDFGVTASKVIVQGHSYGSAVSLDEAGTYHDVDGVVVTSYRHTLDPTAMATFSNSIIPTQLDPKYSMLDVALGYLVPKNGANAELLYYQPNADPNVLALDDVYKDVTCPGELSTFFANMQLDSRLVDVPVISIDGAEDQLFLHPTAGVQLLSNEALEPAYYLPQAQLELVDIPNAGHDLALQLNAQSTFGVIRGWLDRRFGNGG